MRLISVDNEITIGSNVGAGGEVVVVAGAVVPVSGASVDDVGVSLLAAVDVVAPSEPSLEHAAATNTNTMNIPASSFNRWTFFFAIIISQCRIGAFLHYSVSEDFHMIDEHFKCWTKFLATSAYSLTLLDLDDPEQPMPLCAVHTNQRDQSSTHNIVDYSFAESNACMMDDEK
ncbi:MAG: hypothetical protein IIC71_07875 [Acidobacteria bacterium]|nr:hypothetical protein [Acidobacteriota bacterium]